MRISPSTLWQIVNWMALLFFLTWSFELQSQVLEVGMGRTYATPAAAAAFAKAGDTIMIFSGNYISPNRITQLHGEANQYITFLGVDAENVIFEETTQAFHFSDVSYIRIENITIQRQSANGMNIDDGGTFDTPSHHIEITNCIFQNMASQGNNDLLKLSGVDDFKISRCQFRNGANGGSGIDMVGCHNGYISESFFENMGSNAIQAKGGTQFLKIRGNKFKNCGLRTLNLGGSTSLEFFRPQNAAFESADIDVYANIFIGSTAPIAYVGCTRVHVVNNTIINPSNWAIRILQETVDPNRFVPCSHNSFVNNVVYHANSLSRHVNIGPNTLPATFTFSNNLWYNHQLPQNSTPILPVAENNGIIAQNPLFMDVFMEDFSLMPGSPAIDKGATTDFLSDFFNNQVPSGSGHDIGAIEYQQTSNIEVETITDPIFKVYPNPFSDLINIDIESQNIANDIQIIDIFGQILYTRKQLIAGIHTIDLQFLPNGMYIMRSGRYIHKIIKSH